MCNVNQKGKEKHRKHAKNFRFHSGHFALEALKGSHGGKKKKKMCTF
jgi:hypothetical protein